MNRWVIRPSRPGLLFMFMLMLMQSSKVPDGACLNDEDCTEGEAVTAGHGQNH